MKKPNLATSLLAIITLVATETSSADVPVFAVTGSLTAVQQTTKSVLLDDTSTPILQVKTLILSTKSLINLAQGKPVATTLPVGYMLGLTCETNSRLVVVQKATTLPPSAAVLKEVLGTVQISFGSVIAHEVIVTIDGVKGPMPYYFNELGTLDVNPQTPGIGAGGLNLALKETFYTNPALDPLNAYGCARSIAVTNVQGEFEVEFEDTSEVYLQITRGTLNVGRTLLGYIPEGP